MCRIAVVAWNGARGSETSGWRPDVWEGYEQSYDAHVEVKTLTTQFDDGGE